MCGRHVMEARKQMHSWSAAPESVCRQARVRGHFGQFVAKIGDSTGQHPCPDRGGVFGQRQRNGTFIRAALIGRDRAHQNHHMVGQRERTGRRGNNCRRAVLTDGFENRAGIGEERKSRRGLEVRSLGGSNCAVRLLGNRRSGEFIISGADPARREAVGETNASKAGATIGEARASEARLDHAARPSSAETWTRTKTSLSIATRSSDAFAMSAGQYLTGIDWRRRISDAAECLAPMTFATAPVPPNASKMSCTVCMVADTTSFVLTCQHD
ncbi:mll8503 [Mesorhizobium japonicum MAFF 303099]|uniref:Mll8503 protein n=1 Tax=Mesorhizobium japonicum (strain LMG 29417 / CECT 9101 / MAFF 303099) TaxID=266835 RepID=Q982T5_RHILO|nr:mll8503 [Mesorhizobium japonicum MAFF 303099]